MESSVLTLRISAETKGQLEKLATATNRSKSFLAAEAIERYMELEAWQVKEIKQALKEGDAGEFASDKDLSKAIKKYASLVAGQSFGQPHGRSGLHCCR